MATMSSIKFNKGPFLDNTEGVNNPSNTYTNKMQYSMQMGGNGTFNSQEKYYTNIYTTNQNPMYFSFKERIGKLRWKEIMKLDIQQMIKNNDISPLETYLENLIFSNVDENDVELITEATTVKLIKIYQHVLEYLLHTQIRLENENKMLETNYSQVLSDSATKENILKENKTMISSLKKDRREKEMILNTYKCIIEEYKQGGLANTINNRNLKISNSVNPGSIYEKKFFFCQYCSGKKFSSEENLNSHYQRRHPNQIKTNMDTTKNRDLDISDLRQSRREYVKNLENQVEELKNLFTNFMKSNINNESLNKLAENQKVLENKIGEVKYDKEKLLNVMEENFKTTLVELKEFVKNNVSSNNSFHRHEEVNIENNESLIRQKEGIETIKNNIYDINALLTDIKKNQNEKIQNVYEEMHNIKTTISNEMRDLKINTYNNPNININNQSFSEAKYNKLKTESIEMTNTFSISNLGEKINNNKSENLVNSKINNIRVVKPFFNAGPLESDHSDEEIVREKALFDGISRENKNILLTKNKPERVEANNNFVKNQIEENISRSEIESAGREIPKLKVKIPEKLKEEKNNQLENFSQDKPIDISNFTKEKNERNNHESIKNRKNEEQEIILDNFSEDISKTQNLKDIREQNKNLKKTDEQKIKKNNEIENNGNNDDTNEIQFKKSKREYKKKEIIINDVKKDKLENYNLEDENVEIIRNKIMDQFYYREEMFKKANIDFLKLDVEKDEVDFYKRVLQKPNGNKQKMIASEAVDSKINDYIKSVAETSDITLNNIQEKKPEELINLIDNILNYINVQKEKGAEVDVDIDDSEISCEVLFGKFYYDLNNTIYKKICLEDEYNFMINNISACKRNSKLTNNFRETLNLSKPIKDSKFINRMEDKNNQLVESREVNEKIKNFNKDLENKDQSKLTGTVSQKVNIDDEFNH